MFKDMLSSPESCGAAGSLVLNAVTVKRIHIIQSRTLVGQRRDVSDFAALEPEEEVVFGKSSTIILWKGRTKEVTIQFSILLIIMESTPHSLEDYCEYLRRFLPFYAIFILVFRILDCVVDKHCLCRWTFMCGCSGWWIFCTRRSSFPNPESQKIGAD